MTGPFAFVPLAELQILALASATASEVLTPEIIMAVLIGATFMVLVRPSRLRRGRPKAGASQPRLSLKSLDRRHAGPAGRMRPAKSRNWILVDGSNVMHWKDNTPHIEPIRRVVDALKAQGFDPGVVFDANAGWKLFGRYLGEHELGQLLGLPQDQVLVVPKGSPADPWILTTARDFGARIVTNDRYGDWVGDHPQIGNPGFLVHGGLTEGRVWLDGIGTGAGQPSA